MKTIQESRDEVDVTREEIFLPESTLLWLRSETLQMSCQAGWPDENINVTMKYNNTENRKADWEGVTEQAPGEFPSLYEINLFYDIWRIFLKNKILVIFCLWLRMLLKHYKCRLEPFQLT